MTALPTRGAPPGAPGTGGGDNSVAIALGCLFGIGIPLLCCGAYCYYKKKKGTPSAVTENRPVQMLTGPASGQQSSDRT